MWFLTLLACTPDTLDTSTPTPPAPRPSPTVHTGSPLDTGPDELIDVHATWTPNDVHATWATVDWPPQEGLATLTWTDLAGPHAAETDATDGTLMLRALPASSEVLWTLDLSGPQGLGTTGPQTSTVPAPPFALQDWVPATIDPTHVADHWFLTTQFTFSLGKPSYAVLYDEAGRVRWWRQAPPSHRVLRVHLGSDGASVVWASNIETRSTYEGLIVREFLDASPSTTTLAPRLHHDFVEHPGGFAFLSYVDRDLPLLDHGFDRPMTTDAIQVVTEGSSDGGHEVFNFFDDFPTSPSQPCTHATLGSFVPERIEWTHSNSIVADPNGDGWWLLARYLDQIVHVHEDGSLGPIVGGIDPTYAHEGLALPMSHGHFSHILDNGNLLVFDNGDHTHQSEGSQLVELQLNDATQTVEAVWSAPDPLGRFVAYLGDARRLSNGHTWYVNPDIGIFELNPDGQLVWEMRMANQLLNAGRVVPMAPMAPTSTDK